MKSLSKNFLILLMQLLSTLFISSIESAPSRENKNVWFNEQCDLKGCKSIVLAKVVPKNLILAMQDITGKTNVPILIPFIDSKLTGESGFISKFIYGIDFSTFKGCRGTRNCTHGSINGEIIPRDALAIAQEYKLRRCSYDDTKYGLARTVILSRKTSAFYIPSCCTASFCSEFAIAWDQNGYRYQVGIYRLKNFKELLELANSAIDNQP